MHSGTVSILPRDIHDGFVLSPSLEGEGGGQLRVKPWFRKGKVWDMQFLDPCRAELFVPLPPL